MAQEFGPKQQQWVFRFQEAVVKFLTDTDALIALTTEFNNDLYGSGGANALTDAVVQNVLPAATAAILFSAVGALENANAILAQVANSRQSLELMRP